MQDELTKHGLKIYKTMSDRKYTFGEKFKEILIEIAIIVFAVTLSIYFHSWSEHHREQKEVREFIKGLKNDLTGAHPGLLSANDACPKQDRLHNSSLTTSATPSTTMTPPPPRQKK